jgi:ABC-type transport system involved in multi-copper enzyme maturation permease subunit
VYAERRPPAVTGTDRRDRVRWGAVWAGVIVALPTFLLLELALFAVGGLALGLDPDESTTTAGWVTGLVALVAFFLGGLTAGASALWKGASDGLLHGILVWALSLVGTLFFTLLGGGALLGPVSEVITAVSGLQQQVAQGAPGVQLEAAVSTARDAAALAVLGLGLSIVAAAIGGLLGVTMWPRDSDQQVEAIDRH